MSEKFPGKLDLKRSPLPDLFGRAGSLEPFVGQIQSFAFSFAPPGWALCDGQLLQIAQNQALFSLLGTIYGGDGKNTFAVPDLRGRAALHFGNGPGLTNRPIGQRGGVEAPVLGASNIPAHSHSLHAVAEPAVTDVVEGNLLAGQLLYHPPTADTQLSEAAVQSAGASAGHPNMQPYLVISWCIALQGTFPSLG